MTHAARVAAVSLVLAAATPASAVGQTLASRIDAAPAGHVSFTYPARAGVCGNGISFVQTSDGNFRGVYNDGTRNEACIPGPVRVVLDRAGRDIIQLQTYVGPPQQTQGITDLGRVSGQQAVDYLLGLAARAEGSVGRNAIWPATLADSATTLQGLVAIARNQALPRETRSSALSYVGRSGDRVQTIPQQVIDILVGVARDESDNVSVRQSALSTLRGLDHGAGIPQLIEFARARDNVWLSRKALDQLTSSGDPRARAYLRTAVQQDELPSEASAAAIRALGNSYATREDAALLRGLYPKVRSETSKDGILSAVADVGGADNVRWLLDVARNETEPMARRKRAIESASRAGAPIAELIRLYDASGGAEGIKTSLISIYARSGERTAIDKLMAIAKSDPNGNVRRSAINALSNSDDPRVKDLLKELIGR